MNIKLSSRRTLRPSAGRASSATSGRDLGRKHKPDYWLVALCVLLLAIGMMVVYAISPALERIDRVSVAAIMSVKQLIAIGLSLVAFTVTAQVPVKYLAQAYKPLLIVAGLHDTGCVADAGESTVSGSPLGAARWLIVPISRAAEICVADLAGWFLGGAVSRRRLAMTDKTFKPLL